MGPVLTQLPLLAQDAGPNPADLMAARTQMAISLGWHIIIACFGVGFPLLAVFAEWRGYRTGDKVWGTLARRWGRAMGVLFAVGAVSGTILSFELTPGHPHDPGRLPGHRVRGGQRLRCGAAPGPARPLPPARLPGAVRLRRRPHPVQIGVGDWAAHFVADN